jgi:uncharacterized RDD family membrane protein YckC
MVVFQWGLASNLRHLVGITDDWFRDSWNMQLYVSLTISLPVWLYFSYFDSRHSKGTFGKRIFGFRVTDLKLQPIGFGKAFIRTALKLLPWEIAHAGVIFPTPSYYEAEPDIRLMSIIGILLFVAYVLSILFNKERRALYEWMVNTKVIIQDKMH